MAVGETAEERNKAEIIVIKKKVGYIIVLSIVDLLLLGCVYY